MTGKRGNECVALRQPCHAVASWLASDALDGSVAILTSRDLAELARPGIQLARTDASR
jgi:hypothetical protein